MSDSPTTVVELPEQYRDLMRRTLNKGLMVNWIHRDLSARASYDVRSSLAFYDADGDFTMALPASVAELDNFAEILQAMYDKTTSRFYTIGV